MKVNFKTIYALYIQLIVIILLMLTNNAFAETTQKAIFWNTGKKGANIFNHNVTSNDIKAAKQYGIKFIRLAPDKFTSSHRDFLIENADDYRGLIKEDLEKSWLYVTKKKCRS